MPACGSEEYIARVLVFQWLSLDSCKRRRGLLSWSNNGDTLNGLLESTFQSCCGGIWQSTLVLGPQLEYRQYERMLLGNTLLLSYR
jgi:hypothetical protein